MNAEHAAFIVHLKIYDSKLLHIVEMNGALTPPIPRDPFVSLVRAITGQQLSTKAASTIFGRLEKLIIESSPFEPHTLLEVSDATLREVGLSGQKVSYIQAVARAWSTDPTYQKLQDMSDEEVIMALTNIRGVGDWTAQMFLMFTLCRPDVFAPNDLGIRKAMHPLYGIPMEAKPHEWEERARLWSPHRTLACMHLWRSLDQPK